MNTNTTRKRVKIHQLRDDNPLQLNLTLPLSYTIEDIFRDWGLHVGYPTYSFNLVYNEVKLARFGTIEDAEIKNEGNIYCVKKLNAAIWGAYEDSDTI